MAREKFSSSPTILISAHLSILDATPTGDELLLAVGGDESTLKDLAIAIEENHRWGRLFYIDIIDKTGKKIK